MDMDMIRGTVAEYALSMWEESADPTTPFGFAYPVDYHTWDIEVHLEHGSRLGCYKVTHTGQLMELIKVRV